jgi:S-methylmethionine-dependent homocysteine/selenocysteine methylase
LALFRTALPQLSGPTFLTDGGLETKLIFIDGVDLPYFAAFPLVLTDTGKAALARYYEPFLRHAVQRRLGFVLDTPTWRANLDWASKLGYTAAALRTVNRRAVEFVAQLRNKYVSSMPIVINGVIGPRGDGYLVTDAMSHDEAASYHELQVAAFRDSAADMVSATTMTYVAEAIGIALAARAAALPLVVSFTVETDGRLPSGQLLGDAIEETDDSSGGYAAYYMINCAHPEHFSPVVEARGPWVERIGGIRANASRKSHAELDASTTLEIGDPIELGQQYRQLSSHLPQLVVLGGCCGTDERHIAAICEACIPA